MIATEENIKYSSDNVNVNEKKRKPDCVVSARAAQLTGNYFTFAR